MKKLIFILFLSFAALNTYGQSVANTSFSTNIVENSITVSPNPATVDVKISIHQQKANVKNVSIYSIIGSQVFSKNYNSSSKNIDLNVANLKKGKYLIRVIFEDNTTEVVTLIKQ